LNSQCRATKPDGSRCTLSATGQHGLCWAHAPENAAQRRRTASRGGKSKGNQRLAKLDKQLEDLAADTLEDKVERGMAAVVNQIINTRARLIELERKIREQEELEGRLEALEALEDVLKRRTG
jgi:hypothetical protein